MHYASKYLQLRNNTSKIVSGSEILRWTGSGQKCDPPLQRSMVRGIIGPPLGQ